MKKVLLISNIGLDDHVGRADKIRTRKNLLDERGWRVFVKTVPEPYKPSFLWSVWKCYVTVKNQDINVINSISNPFHIHLVGYFIHKLTKVPWLAEFRDPMVENPAKNPNDILTRIAGKTEALTVKNANQVVWGDGIQLEDTYFEEKYPGTAEEKFYKLPYLGFESDKFREAEEKTYENFVITYAGSFYDGWIEPYDFLEGIKEYKKKYGDDILVQFYGDWKEEYNIVIKEKGLTDVVNTFDFVPHKEIIPVLKGSDILLYIGGEKSSNKLSVPSKIYDYIGAKSPILGIVDPEFRVSQIIEKKGLGLVAHPKDHDGIAEAIHKIRTKEFQYSPVPEIYNQFSRKRKMDVLREVLDSVSRGEYYKDKQV